MIKHTIEQWLQTLEQGKFRYSNSLVILVIYWTLTVQSFIVLASLVFELAGGQNDSLWSFTLQKNTFSPLRVLTTEHIEPKSEHL